MLLCWRGQLLKDYGTTEFSYVEASNHIIVNYNSTVLLYRPRVWSESGSFLSIFLNLFNGSNNDDNDDDNDDDDDDDDDEDEDEEVMDELEASTKNSRNNFFC